MAEIYTVRSILGDESLQNLINQGKSQDEIISIAKAYKDEAIKSGDKDALNRMNLVSQKQGRADFFTRLGDKMDANGYETMGSIARGIDIVASKAAAPIAGLMGDSDKEAQILADMKLTQSINEAKKLDEIATTARTQREYMIDSNNLLANAIGSYTKDSKTYARNLIEQAENSGYSAMDRFNIGMATTANATKYFIKSFFYGEDSKQARDIKDAQKILQASRDAYEANNPDKWNVANFAGEMVTDPLNAVGLAKGFKVANTAFKKGANVAFDLAQLGAIGGMAGAIMEYGSYKDKDEQNVAGAAMIGAGAGVALGAGFMALGAGLAKIASRFGQKSALEQNAQIAKDEAAKELEKGTPQDINERLKKISDDIEEAFSADENAENIARLLGQEYDDNINKAIKESEEVSTRVDDSVAKFANDNPNSSASDIEIYINKTYAPSESEKELTRIINDDKPVTPRMAGYRVLGVLQKTMEYKTRFDRDTIIKRFKNHGFSDELANIFADAYTADDISVARNYLDSKVASNRQKSVEDGRNEWVEIMSATKDEQATQVAREPKLDQEQIYNDITSDKTPFKLIDDSDMTPELKSRLENDGYTLEREPESGVWEVSKAISDEEIKGSDEALENAVVKADKLDILDKSKPFRKVDKEDLTADVMNEVIENNIKIWVDNANDEISKIVNIKSPKMVMQGDSIKHILNRHGANSVNVKNGEPEVTIEDIINHSDIVNNADKRTIGVSNNAKALISGKQINGHYVVVETIGNKKGELNLKTMYKVKGKIENNEIFKKSAVLDHRKDGGKAIVSSTSNPLDKTSDASNITSKTIPNQDLKSADGPNEASLNLSRAERRAMGIEEPTQDTFDILKIDKNISDEQVERLLKEIEYKNLKVNLPLRDEEPLGKAFQKNELGYSRKRLLNLALNEQFLKRHKGFIERAEKTQSKAEFQKFLKENKAEVVEYIKDMVTNTLRYIDAYGEGYHFTNISSLRRANEMILNLESGKNFYFYNNAPNKITNPAPKSHYADKLVDGNEDIQGTYKLSDEIKQDLIKSLKEFVGSRQNLAENIADMQSRWSYKIKEQEKLAPSILEGGKKANNGYDKNLLEALKHEQYLLDKFEKKIVKNPQKISSDLEIAKNYLFLKGDTYTKQALDEISQTRQLLEQELNIKPIKEFGTNYAEFYHDGANAIKKLLTEKQGQVAGAFYKDGRDITISWGEAKMANGDIKGYGLSKIEAKHLDDFAIFEGSTPQEKMANGINKIIEKGVLESKNGIDTIIYKKDNREFRVGLSKGFKGVGDDSWIITAYNNKNALGSTETFYHDTFTAKEPLANQQPNSTTTTNKSQELNLSRAERRAMGIEEPKGKTLVIDEKAVKSDVREFGRLADQVGLGFKSAKEAKAVMDKCDKSKFDCGN